MTKQQRIWLYIAIGAVVAYLLYKYFSKPATTSTTSSNVERKPGGWRFDPCEAGEETLDQRTRAGFTIWKCK